jgi:hypothetical protein
MTRDEAIRVGILTLADWHRRDHRDHCVCLEGEQLGAQSAAVVDALAAEGIRFDGYTGTGPGAVGPPPGWSNLLIQYLAPGSSCEQLRSYAKKLARETWDYVNWMTHAKNAGSYDAEIGAAAVSHFLSTITALRMRWAAGDSIRCGVCGSYRVEVGTCVQCGWNDPDYEPALAREISKEEMAARREEPCTPSSDISTFITPNEYP